jgi:hypothetical protein
MTYSSSVFIPDKTPEKHRKYMERDAKEKAIREITKIIKDGEYYTFRIIKNKRQAVHQYTQGDEIVYSFDIKICERETIRIPLTFEERFLAPNKKFFARLKAGIRYLIGR